MRAPAWEGDWPLTAFEYYIFRHTYHGSWDIAMPSGTNILAPVDGVILDYVTGVPNIPGGPGSPSNWVLLGFTVDEGHRMCYYFQHLSQALVHKGQRVSAGHHIGESGTSGYASGPHLHLTLQNGWKNRYNRYDYLTYHNALYPPSIGWERADDMGLSAEDREWIKSQIDEGADKAAHRVWQEEIQNTTDSAKTKYKAQWYLNAILGKVK